MNDTFPTIKRSLLLSILFGFGMAACAHYVNVAVPPKIDLQAHPLIGVMEFTSNTKENLKQTATQQFMKSIQKSQPQVRFLELGAQEEVLKSVKRTRLDPEAVKEVGKKYNVDTVFWGNLDISEVKPKIKLSTDLSQLNASATVKITMTSRHMSADNGATLWTNSRYGEWSLAKLNKGTGSAGSISLNGGEDQYEKYVQDLAFALTDDFRVHYKREKVSKK